MKTILAPVDFSEASDAVLKAAISLASVYEGRIVLLHVVQPPVLTSDFGVGIENIAEIAALAETAATKNLRRAEAKVTRAGMASQSVVATGAPIPLILKQAERSKADFIVMGSHGHTALYTLLVGSTTQGVLKGSTCPVVVLPRQKKAAGKKKAKR
ncbi:MAG TPA: universal stress protein [Opitutaceae bacterium]|nr:universal stress protein [Opitutaceae bacterium]